MTNTQNIWNQSPSPTPYKRYRYMQHVDEKQKFLNQIPVLRVTTETPYIPIYQ